jgi:hypothetical protein
MRAPLRATTCAWVSEDRSASEDASLLALSNNFYAWKERGSNGGFLEHHNTLAGGSNCGIRDPGSGWLQSDGAGFRDGNRTYYDHAELGCSRPG